MATAASTASSDGAASLLQRRRYSTLCGVWTHRQGRDGEAQRLESHVAGQSAAEPDEWAFTVGWTPGGRLPAYLPARDAFA